MAFANQAYESGDRKSLEELFWDWEVGTGTVSGKDVASELVRVIRQIARAQQNIHAVILRIDELKQTDIYCFKLRVAEAQADDIDLLAEMVAKADEDIALLRKRLSLLRGEEDVTESLISPHVKTRVIRFPADKSYGTLYVRNTRSMDYRDWQWLGSARGVKEVFLDKAVRLDVKGGRRQRTGFSGQPASGGSSGPVPERHRRQRPGACHTSYGTSGVVSLQHHRQRGRACPSRFTRRIAARLYLSHRHRRPGAPQPDLSQGVEMADLQRNNDQRGGPEAPSARKCPAARSSISSGATMHNLIKVFAPQRHKEHEGKSVSCLTKIIHQFGSSLYFHKHLCFFVPFVSLW